MQCTKQKSQPSCISPNQITDAYRAQWQTAILAAGKHVFIFFAVVPRASQIRQLYWVKVSSHKGQTAECIKDWRNTMGLISANKDTGKGRGKTFVILKLSRQSHQRRALSSIAHTCLKPSQLYPVLIYWPFKDGGMSKPRARVQRATGPRLLWYW